MSVLTAAAVNAADDFALPFQIERSGLRGRIVRLGPAIDAILARHAYPEGASHLLGEAVAVAACLASTLKYDGVFTVQAKGEGAVHMLVADVTADGDLRGYVGFDAEAVEAIPAEAPAPAARLFGGGYLAFTVDQGEDFDRYQGIVSIEGETLAESVHHYFRQSEQIETGMVAACAKVDGAWRAAALMVQRVPEEGGVSAGASEASEEDWRRALVLTGTVRPEELLAPQLPAEGVLFRLFHEDGVRVYDRKHLSECCRCGSGRAARILASFPRPEIEDMKVDGVVTVTCQFCNRSEVFDDDRLDRIYSDAV